MRKLTLDLDSLDVQSFDPTPKGDAPRGTVRGHYTDNPGCTQFGTMCPSHYDEATTCMVSDLGTCNSPCGNSYPITCRGEQSCVTCQGVQCEEES
jgi:hypothetical protein